MNEAPGPVLLSRRSFALWVGIPLLLAFLCGTALRLYRLDEQILLGDEFHAVRAVVSLDLKEILTSYRESDHCIPLTALYELRVESGIPLRDGFLRLPGMLSGLAFLLLVPVPIGRWLGWDRAVIVAWLFALSPGLVLYSRIARPYMPAVLLSTLAILAFYAWWRDARIRWAAGYAAAAALTFWFSPVMAPFVGAPMVFALLRKLFAPERGPSLGKILATGCGLALALGAVLAPAWSSFFKLLADKSGTSRPGWISVGPLLELQAGSGHGAVALGVWLLGLWGLFSLHRRHPDLALLTGTAVLLHSATIWITSPLGLANPIVWNRYLLVAVPFLLLWVAEALSNVASWRSPVIPRGLARSAVVLLVTGWFVGGPFTQPHVRRSSFLHGNDFLAFYRAPASPNEYLPLAPYHWMAATEGAVVEILGLPTWFPSAHVSAYQRVHRQPVLLAPLEPKLFQRDLELRHYVEPNPRSVLASSARWAAVHLQPAREIRAMLRSDPALGMPRPPPHSRAWLARITEVFESAWGPPDLAADGLLLWDLDRIRLRGNGE